MIRLLKIARAEIRLYFARLDLEWARLDGSVSLITHKQAAYNRALMDLVLLETEA